MKKSIFNAAFVAAYSTNVGGLDTQAINSFVEQIDAGVDDEIIHMTCPEYPSLMDALGMFNHGVAFGRLQEDGQENLPGKRLAVSDALQGMIEVFGDSFGDGESETVDAARQALVDIGYVHPSVRNAPMQEEPLKFRTVAVADLKDIALDWAVETAEGWTGDPWLFKEERTHKTDGSGNFLHRQSSNWAQGGPIIERENIGLLPSGNAYFERNGGTYYSYGETPLIAAMRSYVASKLGDELQIPSLLA